MTTPAAPHPIASHARVTIEPPDPGFFVLTVETSGGQLIRFCLTARALVELRATAAAVESTEGDR